MTVGDICNRNVVVAPKTEMIVDAAKRMRTSHVGDLVVVENRDGRHVPIGIVTDRDIVIGVVAGDPDHINYLLVSDVMTADLVTAQDQDEHRNGAQEDAGARHPAPAHRRRRRARWSAS